MRKASAAILFFLPGILFADLSQTVTLSTSGATNLNLDTGATSASGGDIQWNGSGIAPLAKAKAYNLGTLGSLTSFNKAYFDNLKILATTAAIPAAKLVAGDVFAVFTNGGNTAGVLVTANGGGSITLEFITYIVAVPTGPNITAVRNNSSGIAEGLPNYGIAPSSIFVIVGTGLADPGEPALQSSAAPGLPLTLDGASIAVTVHGVTTHPAIYYTSPTQIAAVLPASTPVGAGTLTVTYKSVASNAAPILVVPAALGINTFYTNSAVATDAISGALLTYTNSGTPGETIILWTTGLGADPADSDTTFSSAPQAVNTPLQIYIGAVPATILYQGSAGYPGVNQINLTIPSATANGCWITVAAVSGGVLSNIATLPINSGGGACQDAVDGITGDQIAPSGSQTLRTGVVVLTQTNKVASNGTTTYSTNTDAAFEKYTGIYTPTNQVSPGGCIVNNLTPVSPGLFTGLDPGMISLTGPGSIALNLPNQLGIKGAFYAPLTAGAIPQTGGTFTFQGSGGADVGSFMSGLTFTNPLLSWTNTSAASAINRGQDFKVTWTGGNPGSFVFVTGTSTSSATSSAPAVTVGFTCLGKAGDGQLTVPSRILSALPPGKGGVEIQNDIYLPLPASGLDIGITQGEIGISAAATFQ